MRSVDKYVNQLATLARKCRFAEARIAAAYFSKRRTKAEHARWLRAQGYKEHSAIKPIVAALSKLYRDIGNDPDPRRYEELAEKLADETKHARLVMDLLQAITGKKTTPKDLLWLPEDRKLARTRARYSKTFAVLFHGSQAISAKEIRRQDEDLERAAITLTEGGGGAIYRICSRLKQRGIDGKIARAFRDIYVDELEHKDAGVHSLAKLVKTKKAYQRAARIICEVSSQRLRMRNEQFGFPLSEREIEKLQRGITKYVPI